MPLFSRYRFIKQSIELSSPDLLSACHRPNEQLESEIPIPPKKASTSREFAICYLDCIKKMAKREPTGGRSRERGVTTPACKSKE